MAQSLFEKLWSRHVIADLADSAALIHVDRIFLHERTGGIALKSLEDDERRPFAPRQAFCTMDHVVDTFAGRTDRTTMPTGSQFIRTTRDAAHRAGITVFDLGDDRQGIVHVISPELGIVLPGLTLVCPDSHTCTQGAFGALAWGIGSSEAEHALATSTLRVVKPKAMRVTISGSLAPGVTAKDLALYILAKHSSVGARGHAVEYAGSAVTALDLEGRMTLCNMATEFSAFTAIIAPDEKVFEYVKGRPFGPKNGADWNKAIAHWQTLRSDVDAVFDAEIAVDAADVSPMVTWGTNPQQAVPIGERVPRFEALAFKAERSSYDRALAYMDLEPDRPLVGLKIDAAFIGSCTNSRISDLRRAARLLKDRKIASGVKAICVPGSSAVKRQAEAEGLADIFKSAGFEWRESGCSMCFFAGGERFGFRERVITSTNRNFESRQGPETRSHLASPETVAASALAGCIADPRKLAAP